MNHDPELNDEQVAELLSRALEPVSPGDDAKARLFSAIDAGAKYAPFCTDLAERFDLSRERILELLGCIDEPGAWTRGIHPIQGFLHFRPGPRFESLHGGFKRANRAVGGVGDSCSVTVSSTQYEFCRFVQAGPHEQVKSSKPADAHVFADAVP